MTQPKQRAFCRLFFSHCSGQGLRFSTSLDTSPSGLRRQQLASQCPPVLAPWVTDIVILRLAGLPHSTTRRGSLFHLAWVDMEPYMPTMQITSLRLRDTHLPPPPEATQQLQLPQALSCRLHDHIPRSTQSRAHPGRPPENQAAPGVRILSMRLPDHPSSSRQCKITVRTLLLRSLPTLSLTQEAPSEMHTEQAKGDSTPSQRRP